METGYYVKLSRIIKEHNLDEIYMPCDPADIEISTTEVNRPGLQLAGFFDFYDNDRIQILGKSEFAYLEQFQGERLDNCLDHYFATRFPVAIITRSIQVSDVMLAKAKKYEIPLLSTDLGTSEFLAAIIATLNVKLAPRITRHGVLVEVYGEGILLLGESGVGKSETAIELVKRGHRLIADDAVEIRRTSAKTLVGSSPENIRHFLELRGIGIINARRLFGIGSVKVTEKIDLIIQMEQWDAEKVYDRMGMESEYMEILGIKIPSMTVPVKPGRNLAIIIEVASMNNRQKKMGYNSARELLTKLGMADPEMKEDPLIYDEGDWNKYE